MRFCGLQRYLLPWRAAAHDTDGLDLQGLENVRRHEDEILAERDAALISRIHGTRGSSTDQEPDRTIHQQHVRPRRIRVRGMEPSGLDQPTEVS